jgi:hypothetical protein
MEAVHHLTYVRIGREDLADLQAVCRACHQYESGRSDFDPVALSKALGTYALGRRERDEAVALALTQLTAEEVISHILDTVDCLHLTLAVLRSRSMDAGLPTVRVVAEEGDPVGRGMSRRQVIRHL